jgi:hypothetical protein
MLNERKRQKLGSNLLLEIWQEYIAPDERKRE